MSKVEALRGRGIAPDFTNHFKKSKLYTYFYQKYKHEIIVGIRDGYINLYYNCDCIAKIYTTDKNSLIRASINRYYLGESDEQLINEETATDQQNKKAYVEITEDDLLEKYETVIKPRSDKRRQLEKQAQAKLYLGNNSNPSSNWFCIDLEYAKNQQDGRFDLIAISKNSPYRVALIEVKYNAVSFDGKSGVRSHIEDYYKFFKNPNSFDRLKREIILIINGLEAVGIPIPRELTDIQEDSLAPEPEFYIITLDNNAQSPRHSTPKMKMGARLFKNNRWGTKQFSSCLEKGNYFHLIENDLNFNLTFLFSKATLPELGIQDIIDDKQYEREIIRIEE